MSRISPPIGHTIGRLHSNSRTLMVLGACLPYINSPVSLPLPWFCIAISICELKLAWSQSGQNKCSLISMVQRQEQFHTNIHIEIREETVPGLPIIRAEVYGRRELQGITEIKLHRRGTSNTGETSQALERVMGYGWVGNREGEISERCERDVLHLTHLHQLFYPPLSFTNALQRKAMLVWCSHRSNRNVAHSKDALRG